MCSDQTDRSDDLNASALTKFVDLVRADTSLNTEWKSAVEEMVIDGIPKDLSALDCLLKEKSNDET